MSQFVTDSRARQFALEYAERIGRGDVIKRVSPECFDALDGVIRATIRRWVQRHPSAFRTLKPK